MALLIVEHRGNVEGASLSGRVLIGRRPSNHVVVDDPAVSRIHAWIDTAGRRYCITDAGSRTGTFVNGQRVGATKVELRDGDRITVGPARLIFRADGGTLPAGASQLNFDDHVATPTGAKLVDGGVLFDCTCGAPLWISAEFAGRLGKCRYCGAVVRVPVPAGPKSHAPAGVTSHAPASSAPASATSPPLQVAAPSEACGICQSPISAGEATTACPSCGLRFHADCWTENMGCSAYGCAQVNALAPPQPDPSTAATSLIAGEASAETAVDEISAAGSAIPAEHALLAASVAALLLGALAFGAFSLITLIASVVLLARRRRSGEAQRARGGNVLLAAAALSLLGVAAGLAVSYIWWLA